MRFSKTELNVLEQVSKGNNNTADIASALNKDKSQIYRTIKTLNKKRFARLENKQIIPSNTTHVQILLQELSKNKSIINNISGCGIRLYQKIIEPKTINEISKETSLKRSTIFAKIKLAKRTNFIKQEHHKYQLNHKIWPGIKEFLTELTKYEKTTDERTPPGSQIHYKTDKEIVFSTKAEWDATPTGFSAYHQFGIKIYTTDNTYHLPKKTLSKQEIFKHSIQRAEKDGTTRDIILIALFYIKHQKDISKTHNKIVENIKKILKGETIKNYPKLSEIKERADIYDIKI